MPQPHLTVLDLAPHAQETPLPAAKAASRLDAYGAGAGWAMAWAAGLLALAAVGLLLTGSWTVFTGLVLAALPGAVSTVWRPVGSVRVGALTGWAILLTAAALWLGGTAGPLLVLTLGPALAGVALGAWRPGAVLAGLALLATALLTVLGPTAPAPTGGAAVLLAIGVTGLFAALTALASRAALRVAMRPAPAPSSATRSAAIDLFEQPLGTPPELEIARAAAAAAQAERDAATAESAAKSRFLANMSHELRTPLNAIIGFSDIMRNKLFGPLPERYGEYAEMIHESGQHLTDLINDILDMSKLEADRYELHRERFDAREPITSALKLMRLQADDKGVYLRADLPTEALYVDADRRAVKQIVLNLVSNALKFTPPEGRIDVTLRALGGALELVVADTGMGIAAEDLARLGRPYEQTDAGRRAQGTGLGLSLVKALTTLHGGEFSLESRLGEGSAATVRLPVLLIDAPAVETGAAAY